MLFTPFCYSTWMATCSPASPLRSMLQMLIRIAVILYVAYIPILWHTIRIQPPKTGCNDFHSPLDKQFQWLCDAFNVFVQFRFRCALGYEECVLECLYICDSFMCIWIERRSARVWAVVSVWNRVSCEFWTGDEANTKEDKKKRKNELALSNKSLCVCVYLS